MGILLDHEIDITALAVQHLQIISSLRARECHGANFNQNVEILGRYTPLDPSNAAK